MINSVMKRAFALIVCQLICFAPLAIDAATGQCCIILNWLMWAPFLPAILVATHLNPRPPSELTYAVAFVQAGLMGFILWGIWIWQKRK